MRAHTCHFSPFLFAKSASHAQSLRPWLGIDHKQNNFTLLAEMQEQDSLEGVTRKLLEYEQVSIPQWRHKIDLVDEEFRKKEEQFKEAQQRANEASKLRQEVEFACKVLDARVKAITGEINDTAPETLANEILESADKWNSMTSSLTHLLFLMLIETKGTSDSIAQYNISIAESTHFNQQLSTQIALLEQENVSVRMEIARINHRKRVQAGSHISSNKRLVLVFIPSTLQLKTKQKSHRVNIHLSFPYPSLPLFSKQTLFQFTI